MGWVWLGLMPQAFLETEQALEAGLRPGLGDAAVAQFPSAAHAESLCGWSWAFGSFVTDPFEAPQEGEPSYSPRASISPTQGQ